jgi:hypothetical protein
MSGEYWTAPKVVFDFVNGRVRVVGGDPPPPGKPTHDAKGRPIVYVHWWSPPPPRDST